MNTSMEIVAKVKKVLGIASNYGLSKAMRARGCEITTNGIDGYDKKPCKSIRLDILTEWQSMVAEKGTPLEVFWSWVKKDSNHIK